MKIENCVFCNLENRKIIRETKNTMIILSNPHLVYGHCLVMPKNHYEKLFEVPKEICYELIDEVAEFQELLMKRLDAPGIDVRQNFRPFIPQGKIKVNHLHFHLLPRWSEDNLYQKSMKYEKDIFTDLNSELYNKLMEKLK